MAKDDASSENKGLLSFCLKYLSEKECLWKSGHICVHMCQEIFRKQCHDQTSAQPKINDSSKFSIHQTLTITDT